MRQEITAEQIEQAYIIGRKIRLSLLSPTDGVKFLTQQAGMNNNSAKNYLRDLDSLFRGNVYKRAMSALSYKVILKHFYNELPLTDFKTVLQSVELHLEYRWSKSKAKHLEVRALVESYRAKLATQAVPPVYPDEAPEQPIGFAEGAVRQVTINTYERDPKARAACIEKYGAICQVCDFNFETKYGEIGQGFIHVHHKIDLATIGESYQVDPINDLIPVCPNCHVMLHTETPAMSIEKLKQIIDTNDSQ